MKREINEYSGGFANAKANKNNLKIGVHLKGFMERQHVHFFLTLIYFNCL
jgi:hypothetical protein